MSWNSRDWRDSVRKKAHLLVVRNYNGELQGIELEDAIIDLVVRAADRKERENEQPTALRIVRSSYQPGGAA